MHFSRILPESGYVYCQALYDGTREWATLYGNTSFEEAWA